MSHLLLCKQFNLTHQRDKLEVRLCKNEDIIVVLRSGLLSRKLTETQRRYPVTEQELLAITETLKYYKHMLYGHALIVKIDHKNLTHQVSTLASDCVLHQRLLIDNGLQSLW